MTASSDTVLVIGGGLAGSEAAWQLAERGIPVQLFEMRPKTTTAAHRSAHFAELVCSNSLKSLSLPSAAATLKYELAALGSFLLKEALDARVPAGLALAVDRDDFARRVSERIRAHPLIEVVPEEVTSLTSALEETNAKQAIVATGPLTSDALAADIAELLGQDYLAFYDAAAPIVEAESLDLKQLVSQSRFNKGEGEYLNALLNREQYLKLVNDLVQAERVILKDFEKRELFSACMPVEEVARSGEDALRFGALKPIGLSDPRTEQRPYAAIQLRAENPERSAWNLVGFQTNLTFSAQERVFRSIPGFEKANFTRYGVMHRNTFINAPKALGASFESLSHPQLCFAGQITGTEGYTEAIASGLFAALHTYASLKGRPKPGLPTVSAFGALIAYATNADTHHYQPMHVNYGLMPPLAHKPRGKRQRYAAYSKRALAATVEFIGDNDYLNFLPSYTLPALDEESSLRDQAEQK